jgi:hypothetical protein
MKKLFKIALLCAAVIGALVSFSSCSKDSMTNSKLIGKWQAETITAGPVTVDFGEMLEGGEMFITLKKGGEFISELIAGDESETIKGTWSYADGILTTTIEGEEAVMTVVELTNSKLVVSQKTEILDQETEATLTFKKVR